MTTWVQGNVLEMPKSFSLGLCAAKTLARQNKSAAGTSYELENVDFTLVLYAFVACPGSMGSISLSQNLDITQVL